MILPDYQGIGIGRAFLNVVAKKYRNDGFEFCICTSAKNLIMSLGKDDNWIFTRYGRSKFSTTQRECMARTKRYAVKTATFFAR